jgi:RHS repeat-associated protein
MIYQGQVTNQISYVYDQVGNRARRASTLGTYNLPSAVPTASYNAANQQLTYGTYTMFYDANGNVTNIANSADGATRSLVWNARNQLATVSGAVTASFVYDGLGRRIARTVNGTTENYLYDGLDIIQQLDGSSAVGANYFRGLHIDEPWMRTDVGAATTNRIYLADALGSIIALADDNQFIQTAYTYDPFGATTIIGAANKNSFEFTGRENDGTGLYFYRARYYNPGLARFVSEDPLGLAISAMNFYLYAANIPMLLYDPLGLSWQSVAISVAEGVLVGAVATVVVAAAAPVAVAGLVAVGVAEATAIGTVTTGLYAAGALGTVAVGVNAYNNAAAGNWDNVGYDVGMLGGGYLIGGLGIGAAADEGITGELTGVPPSWNPLTADEGFGFNRNDSLPFFQDYWNYVSAGPTPTSAGATTAGIGGVLGGFVPHGRHGCP